MKIRWQRIVFVIGVVLAVLGFYVEQLEWLIAPSHYSAQAGVRHIREHDVLRTGDPGFDVFCRLTKARIQKERPDFPGHHKIDRFELGPTVLGKETTLGLQFFFEGDPQRHNWNLGELQHDAESLGAGRTKAVGHVLFWLGTLVAVSSGWPRKKSDVQDVGN